VSLLVVGSVAFDSVRTPHGEAREVLGGSAVYFAVAASYLTGVRMLAVVGDDFGEEPLAQLRARGIDLSGLQVAAGETFRWSGEYSDDLNQRSTIATHLNVFESFRPQFEPVDRNVSHLFLGNVDPDLQRFVLNETRPGLSACDTMNFWIEQKIESIKRLLPAVGGLLINESEVRLLAGEPNMFVAARRLLDLGLRFLVVKRGEYGAALFVGGRYFTVPAYPVEKPVDPTGAGDSFAGGFMGHLARTGRDDAATLRQAMLYGAVLASFCVEDFSIRRFDLVTPQTIEARCADLRGFMSLDGAGA
jgi:sugar/nucleoside kinase (ribokinase family)